MTGSRSSLAEHPSELFLSLNSQTVVPFRVLFPYPTPFLRSCCRCCRRLTQCSHLAASLVFPAERWVVQSEPAVSSPPLLPSLQGLDFLPLLAVNPVCALRALQRLLLVCLFHQLERYILYDAFIVLFRSSPKDSDT